MNTSNNTEKFFNLASSIITKLGIDMPRDDFDSDTPGVLEVEIEGVEMTVAYFAPVDFDKFSVLCRFGQVPVDGESDVLRRALEVNLMLGRAGDVRLGADPVSKDVVLYLCLPLQTSTAESTLASMVMMANQAHMWRRMHFLDGDAPPLESHVDPIHHKA